MLKNEKPGKGPLNNESQNEFFPTKFKRITPNHLSPPNFIEVCALGTT
jgi:hypothetical protein